MRVCFVFPHPVSGPTGGYKVVYEYANRLVADGIDTVITYSGSIFWKQKPLIFKLSNCFRFLQSKIRGYSGRKWFPLDKRVEEYLSFSMNYRHIPKADVYIATSPYTAWYINDYPISPSRKFYFIQGREDWGPGIKAIVDKTYKMPFTKIVVSSWLQRLLSTKFCENSNFIPNGFDFGKFSCNIPIVAKDKMCVSMLFHRMPLKRCVDAISAVHIVKKKYPELRVLIFGVPDRPENLPDWFHYYQMPDALTHNRINNEAAIYVGSSETEGWGLTVGEAMICGQAVCCTDNDGHKEMAIDGKTALLSPVRDPEALAANIIRLIEDDDLRIKIAKEGNKYIQQFNWENSYQQFKQILMYAARDI